MDVGQRIKEYRVKKGLTVDELAEKLKKNRATIYRYENGDIENLPITILEPIAKALGTTPTFLMGWEENDEASFQGEESIYPNEKKEVFTPTDHERKVLYAYRSQPTMQPAVDRLLGIPAKRHIHLEGNVAARGFQETSVNQDFNVTPDNLKKLLDDTSQDIDF